MLSILNKARQHQLLQLPFVLYSKPESEQLIGIFQTGHALHRVIDFTETGFVFAPFSGGRWVIIPEQESEVLTAAFPYHVLESSQPIPFQLEVSEVQAKYEALIQNGIDAIADGKFQKVVLSRNESVPLSKSNAIDIFQKLLHEYRSAFSYCFYHPAVGLWLGGFSEQLLKMNGHHFKTMAVAGTQLSHENEKVAWGDKEIQEQQIVTDYIVNEIRPLASNIVISEPYTLKAGRVMHIKTDISGTLNEGAGLREMIKTLHPTPAVCGFPKAAALDFIVKNEGYDREYYSGFLGEFNKDFGHQTDSTELYVNLRCMQIKEDAAILYIGGGITHESEPEKEWQETVNKSLAMKQILNKQSI